MRWTFIFHFVEGMMEVFFYCYVEHDLDDLMTFEMILMIFFCFFCFTGGCCGSTKKRTIVGGWAWAWWLVTDVQKLSLEVMTLNPMCEMVETAQGVALTVTGVAQVKIMKVISPNDSSFPGTFSLLYFISFRQLFSLIEHSFNNNNDLHFPLLIILFFTVCDTQKALMHDFLVSNASSGKNLSQYFQGFPRHSFKFLQLYFHLFLSSNCFLVSMSLTFFVADGNV